MTRKKYRMGSAKHENKTVTCSRGTMWPPIEVVVYGGVEEAREEVTPARYHAITIWQQRCGLTHVNPEECLKCLYVLLDGDSPLKVKTKIHSTTATRKAKSHRAHFDKKD